MEDKKKICCNCKYGGTQFKIDKLTHLHCQKQTKEPPTTAWETLMEFGHSCEDFKLKETKVIQLNPRKEVYKKILARLKNNIING